MKKIQRSIFIILIIMLNFLAKGWSDTKQIVQNNLSKVVMIITFDSNNQPLSIGSGFYISSNGEIATNYHVIEGAASAVIKEINSDTKMALDTVVQIKAEFDLAIIKINKPTSNVTLGNDDTLLVGDKIVAVGNPEGLEGTVSEGIISGFRSISKDFRLIQITAPISLGSSGGPLFNIRGEVVGITTASFSSGQNLNFAIPISRLKNLISEEALNLKLNQIEYPILPNKRGQLDDSKESELVRVIDYGIERTYNDTIEFSIYNGSQNRIKNIKLVMIFYKGEWSKAKKVYVPASEYPLHYIEIEINDTIPPRLSKRFYRRVSLIKTTWAVEIRVLNYDILHSP